jgi:hypothetical protein
MCLLDTGEAVSKAMDSFTFTWAAMKRCKIDSKDGLDHIVKCEIDVASATESVNSLVNVILKAVDKCDGLKEEHAECGLQAGKLTEHLAGLAAATGSTYEKCHNVSDNHAAGLMHGTVVSPLMCTLDMKRTAVSIFKATKALMKMKKRCKKKSDPTKCATNVLEIVASFSAMGEYIAGAVGECKPNAVTEHAHEALCAVAVDAFAHHLMKMSKAGLKMGEACKGKGGKGGGKGKKRAKQRKASMKQDAVKIIEQSAHSSPEQKEPKAKKAPRSPPPPVETHLSPPKLLHPKQAPPPRPVPVPAPSQLIAVEMQTPRLYDKNLGGATFDFGKLCVVLGALLPVTVVISFFGGRLHARRGYAQATNPSTDEIQSARELSHRSLNHMQVSLTDNRE